MASQRYVRLSADRAGVTYGVEPWVKPWVVFLFFFFFFFTYDGWSPCDNEFGTTVSLLCVETSDPSILH